MQFRKKVGFIMEQNEKLDIYFYSYAGFEIFLAIIGAWLITKGTNIMVLILWLHIGAQVFITYEGKKKNKYDTYRMYMGFVVPFFMLSVMLWYNTF